MEKHIQLCAVCAWREFCTKKYSIKAEPGSFRCPDFVRDLTIKEDIEEKHEAENKQTPGSGTTGSKK